MTKKKSDLPPMPEHDGTDNCPGCAAAEKVIKEMEAGPIIARFKKLGAMLKAEHEAIEKEFGVRLSTVFISTLQNEQTDHIGISPKEIMVKSKDREVIMELLQDLNKNIMPDLMSKLGELFGGPDNLKDMMSRGSRNSHRGPSFMGMGQPGEA